MEITYSTINFYDKFKLKYREYLKPEIVSIIMIQTLDEVYLETIEMEMVDGMEKQTLKRIGLSFIRDGEDVEDDEPFLSPKDPIERNVRKFIDEFLLYSIINTTDLFTDEASDRINKKYNTFGVDL